MHDELDFELYHMSPLIIESEGNNQMARVAKMIGRWCLITLQYHPSDQLSRLGMTLFMSAPKPRLCAGKQADDRSHLYCNPHRISITSRSSTQSIKMDFGSGASNVDLSKLSDKDKQELQQFVVNESQKARIQQCAS